MRDPSQLCYIFSWLGHFLKKNVLSLNRLLCGEHLLGAGYVDSLDFSSLIEDLIKTQGSLLDVDLQMELTDVVPVMMTLTVDIFSDEF